MDGCHTTHRMIPTFVLDPLGIGNHQKAGCVPAPRESHPSEVLSELPPLVATVLSRSTCGWTGVSLSLLRLMAIIGCNPIFKAGMARSPAYNRVMAYRFRGWHLSTPAAERS